MSFLQYRPQSLPRSHAVKPSCPHFFPFLPSPFGWRSCKWNDSLVTPFNRNYSRRCTGRERIGANQGYRLEGQLQFVSDAVLAFAYALRDMHQKKCGQPGLCDSMRPVDGTELLKSLKSVHFTGQAISDCSAEH